MPSGDIILRQGTPLEILCILSPEVMKQGFNSSQMVFYHETFMVQPQFVNVINESTARLYIESLPVMNEMFYCRLVNGTEETNVCLNSVIIARLYHINKLTDPLNLSYFTLYFILFIINSRNSVAGFLFRQKNVWLSGIRAYLWILSL